jgi:hypothetical protein
MTDFDAIAEPDPARPECAAGRIALQRLLDGEPDWDSVDAAAHRATCQACREELALAGVLSKPAPPVVPAGLADRVLDRALAARRRSRAIRFAGAALTLAASVVVAIVVFRPPAPAPEPSPVAVVPAPKVEPPAPPESTAKPLGDSVAEAREAIAALTRRAVETSDQSARLLPRPGMPETPDVGDRLEPLADARSGAARSVEPIGSSARRAFNLFIRAADPPDRRD